MKSTKENKGLKQINLIPIGSTLITTAHIQKIKKTEGIILGKTSPIFQSVQQVLAVGPRVEDVKIGDWIYIDMERFVKHVKVQSEIKVGVGGADMIKEEFIPPGWVAPGDDNSYFKLTDREIEGVIINHSSLPKELREHMTIKQFEADLAKENLEADKAKKAFDVSITKEVESTHSAPSIVDFAGNNRF